MNELRAKSVVVAARCVALVCVCFCPGIGVVSTICADAPAAWSKSASDGNAKSSTQPHRSSDTRASFTIVGTDCYTCVERMKRKFKRVPGVKKVYIMCWEPYEAFVNFDSTKTSWPQIAQAIADEKAQLVNVKIEPLLPKTKTK